MPPRPPTPTLFPTRRSSDLNPAIAYWAENESGDFNLFLMYWRPAGSATPVRVMDSQGRGPGWRSRQRSEEQTSEPQSDHDIGSRLLLEKKNHNMNSQSWT